MATRSPILTLFSPISEGPPAGALQDALQLAQSWPGDARLSVSKRRDENGDVLACRESHSRMWGGDVGEMLSTMLAMADYHPESQNIHKSFFTHCVAPSLGPYPTADNGKPGWKSFMTDDHTPLELSWAWSSKRDTPVVRYSAEPIGWLAGSASDPFNNKATVRLLGWTLPLAPGLDLHWYRHFSKTLLVNKPGRGTAECSKASNAPSQSFIAFDLDKDLMVVKYYFMPTLKASCLGISSLELVEYAILTLPMTRSTCFQGSFRIVADYVRSHVPEERPAVEILAVDCVDPLDARIKIYIRSRQTTFNSMLDVMSLGGRLPCISEKARSSLRDLWCAVFGLGDDDEDALYRPLPQREHRTGGILYYLDLTAGSQVPRAKVYLPARHYAKSDDQIARGLSKFLSSRGKSVAGGSYYDGVTRLCKHRKLADGLGFHTYVSCAIKNDTLDVTSYFNPEVYSRIKTPLEPSDDSLFSGPNIEQVSSVYLAAVPTFRQAVLGVQTHGTQIDRRGDEDTPRGHEGDAVRPAPATIEASHRKQDEARQYQRGRSAVLLGCGSYPLPSAPTENENPLNHEREEMARFLQNYVVSAVLLGTVWLLARAIGWVIQKTVICLLPLLHSIKNANGGKIRGPDWKWVDGQAIDKFLDGRARSEEWRQYGPVYRIWSGTTPEIVVTKAEDIRAFHSDSGRHSKARSSNAGWLFHQLLGDCMGLVNGARWHTLRAEFAPTFSSPQVLGRMADLDEEAAGYVDRLGMQRPREDRFTVGAADAVSRFPFFCTASRLYGPLDEREKERLWSLGQKSLGLMGYVLRGGAFRFAFSRLLHRKAARELDDFQGQWAQFNLDMYRSRSGMSTEPAIVSAWQMVVDGRVLHTLSEILFANLDVATGVLTWLLYFLAADAAVQREVREEIQSNSSAPGAFAARKNTLLAHCLLESFRLRPFTGRTGRRTAGKDWCLVRANQAGTILAFSIPESSPTEKLLGGYRIPANTSVVVNTLAVNYNKAFWGEDSDKFRPKRFRSVKSIDLRYNLFTFGFGTRKCLGQHFGDAMTKLFIARLLSQYEVTLASGGDLKHDKAARDKWVPISQVEMVLSKI